MQLLIVYAKHRTRPGPRSGRERGDRRLVFRYVWAARGVAFGGHGEVRPRRARRREAVPRSTAHGVLDNILVPSAAAVNYCKHSIFARESFEQRWSVIKVTVAT